MIFAIFEYWVRRMFAAKLWIWFAFDCERLCLVHLGSSPPIPTGRAEPRKTYGHGAHPFNAQAPK